jgi:hypothetical protein
METGVLFPRINRGAIPPLPYTPSWRAHKQLYRFTHIIRINKQRRLRGAGNILGMGEIRNVCVMLFRKRTGRGFTQLLS